MENVITKKVFLLLLILLSLTSCSVYYAPIDYSYYNYNLIRIREMLLLVLIILDENFIKKNGKLILTNIFNRIYYAYFTVAILYVYKTDRTKYNSSDYESHKKIWTYARYGKDQNKKHNYYRLKDIREKYDYGNSEYKTACSNNEKNYESIIKDITIICNEKFMLDKIIKNITLVNIEQENEQANKLIKDILSKHDELFKKLNEIRYNNTPNKKKPQ